MQAYVYTTEGKLRFEEREVPKAAKGGAVIEVKTAAICGTDLRAHRFGSKSIQPPRVIGHEAVGEIVETGEQLNGFSVGDRVQIVPAIGCGQCRQCKMGHTNLCDYLETIGFQYDGAFAKYMAVPPSAFRQGNVHKLQDEIPDDLAILAEPTACILNSHEFLDLEHAESVAIFGSGFIGCMHAEIALSRGVKKVFILEIDENRRKFAGETIPEAVLMDPAEEGFYDAIRSQTGGNGVDVSIVACSVGKAQADAMNITAKLGRVSLFGGLAGEATGFIDSNIIHYREVSVYGVHASTPEQNRRALDMFAAGKVRTEPYRRNVFALKDMEKAFEELESGRALKAIIRP